MNQQGGQTREFIRTRRNRRLVLLSSPYEIIVVTVFVVVMMMVMVILSAYSLDLSNSWYLCCGLAFPVHTVTIIPYIR